MRCSTRVMDDRPPVGESNSQPEWQAVGTAASLAEGQMVGVLVDGHNIALYNIAGEYYATDDVCPHAQALLSDGFLDEGVVECPLHGGRFEVATGRALGPPVDRSIAVYKVRVVDEQMQVSLHWQTRGVDP